MKIHSHRLLAIVSAASSAGYLGIIFGNVVLKYLSASLITYVIVISINGILKRKRSAKIELFVQIYLLIFGVIILRSVIGLSEDISFKNFTDIFFLIIPFAYLPLSGLLYILIINSERSSIDQSLWRFFWLAAPLYGAISLFTFPQMGNVYSWGLSYNTFNNFVIPISLLSLSEKKNYKAIGWIFIIVLFAWSGTLGSRSYNLVAVYIASLAFLAELLRIRHGLSVYLLGVVGIFGIAWLGGLNSTIMSSSDKITVIEKYQFDTLRIAFKSSLESGNWLNLFFWEGNSRVIILVDAFGNFEAQDWVIGRGVLAQYDSFISRRTIEIGLAQDLFRWGLAYVVPLILWSIYSGRAILKRDRTRGTPIPILAAVIVIIFLDRLVAAIPAYDVYHLLFFAGVAKAVAPPQPGTGSNRRGGATAMSRARRAQPGIYLRAQ